MKIALTNIPPEHGERVARLLVEEHVVACVNMYPIRSCYFWKGKLCFDEEITLMMKVSKEGVGRLKQRLCALHPYELPAFVVLDIDQEASLREYIDFVRSGTYQETVPTQVSKPSARGKNKPHPGLPAV
jgi:periplasmic divalent cation tolerance protein